MPPDPKRRARPRLADRGALKIVDNDLRSGSRSGFIFRMNVLRHRLPGGGRDARR